MQLYFRNSRGKERLIAEPCTVQDMWNEINMFLAERDFNSYYQRYWAEPDLNVVNVTPFNLIIDVGSHSEFFVVKCITDRDTRELDVTGKIFDLTDEESNV